MKAVGIIAEYNPFHNGHRYHLEQAKFLTDTDAVVVVMSGAVTQRGELAICDKWSRARIAVDQGADLILELPAAFAVNSAEEFARGGISILDRLGCVTDLVFGCESEPSEIISMAEASARKEEAFSQSIRAGLDKGLSYPVARSQAMCSFLPEAAIASLDRPNDILAAEYVRQLTLRGSSIVPHGVIRRGKYHDPEVVENDKQFSSATAVRRAILEQRWEDVERSVPEAVALLLKELYGQGEFEGKGLDAMILSRIWTLGPEELRKIYGVSEGLEYRIWNSIFEVTSIDELLETVSSGRYTTARVRRVLIHSLLGLTKDRYQTIKEAADQGTLYGHVLACNETGAKLLKQIKKAEDTIPIYTNLNRELTDLQKKFVRGEETLASGYHSDGVMNCLRMDIRAAEIARMGRGKRIYDGSDFVKGPYIAHKIEKNHK